MKNETQILKSIKDEVTMLTQDYKYSTQILNILLDFFSQNENSLFSIVEKIMIEKGVEV
jgi:hypothetical protein